jgi:AcrR family transcriptional regulator
MSPEDRREMIVRAVLPLVMEHGAAVTSSQIARAAGIGEGTIFRAFKDKDELLDTCMTEALKPDDALAAIAEIPLDQPLEARLLEAAETLDARLQRMGALMAAMHASGHSGQRGGDKSLRRNGRRESMAAMRAGIVDLFEPERDKLRLPPEQLASVFLSMLFTHSRMSTEEGDPTQRDLIDVFLNGALEAE